MGSPLFFFPIFLDFVFSLKLIFLIPLGELKKKGKGRKRKREN